MRTWDLRKFSACPGKQKNIHASKTAQFCSKMLKICSNLLPICSILPKNNQFCSTCEKLLKIVQKCSNLPAVEACDDVVKDVCILLCAGSQSAGDRLPRSNPFLIRQVSWSQRWRASILAEQAHHMNFWLFLSVRSCRI